MPKKTEIARRLRRDMTDAERRLWARLRNRQLGVKFRRQMPIDRFVADFGCEEAKLVIELDGGQHAVAVERDRDAPPRWRRPAISSCASGTTT